MLDLRTILIGEDNTNLTDLSNFIQFNDGGGADTTISIDVDGDTGGGFQASQTILLQGVTEQDLNGGVAPANNEEILNYLLTNNQLLTD